MSSFPDMDMSLVCRIVHLRPRAQDSAKVARWAKKEDNEQLRKHSTIARDSWPMLVAMGQKVANCRQHLPTNDPNRPELADCRVSAPGAYFGELVLVEIGPKLPNSRQVWPITGQSWSIPSKYCSNMAGFGPTAVKTDPNLVGSGPHCPTLDELSQISAHRPSLTGFGRDSANFDTELG